MIVEVGNLSYFIWILICIGVFIGIGLLLKNQDTETKYKILLIIAFINFAIHFLKMFIPPYCDEWPESFRHSTLGNICAVSTVAFPFILLSKNNYAKDYMFYMGLLSGLAAIVYPTEAIDEHIFELDVIRFYICHMLIFIIPFYMVYHNLHKLEYKRIFFLPISLVIVFCIILVNEIILMEAGFVGMRDDNFLVPSYRNSSFVFGINDDFEKIGGILFDWLVPKPFKTVMVGEYAGNTKYMPVLWVIGPAYFYFSIVGSLIYLGFTKLLKRGIINDLY